MPSRLPIIHALCAKHPLLAAIGSSRLSMGIGPSASAVLSAHNAFSPNDCRSSDVLNFRRRLGPSRGLASKARVSMRCEKKMNTSRGFSFFRCDGLPCEDWERERNHPTTARLNVHVAIRVV